MDSTQEEGTVSCVSTSSPANLTTDIIFPSLNVRDLDGFLDAPETPATNLLPSSAVMHGSA
jgi:hypothetical protein